MLRSTTTILLCETVLQWMRPVFWEQQNTVRGSLRLSKNYYSQIINKKN